MKAELTYSEQSEFNYLAHLSFAVTLEDVLEMAFELLAYLLELL